MRRVFADLEHFLEDQRSARNCFQDEQLAALDALGDGHFAFAREQRNGAHFAEIHANGVVGFFKRAGGEIEIAVGLRGFFLRGRLSRVGGIRGRQRSFGGRQIFVHIDAVALEGREQIVDFLRGVDLGRQDIVHLIVEQVTAFLAHRDELSYLIVFFLKSQTHASPSKTQSRRCAYTMAKRPG